MTGIRRAMAGLTGHCRSSKHLCIAVVVCMGGVSCPARVFMAVLQVGLLWAVRD